jgi:hypothetical protein
LSTAGFRGISVVFQLFAPNDIFLSKKRHLVLDTAEQDVITPLASGAQPTPHGSESGTIARKGRMPG